MQRIGEGRIEIPEVFIAKAKGENMTFKFFFNKKCECYPCHKGILVMNCIFCFCPLYHLKNCGGNFTITKYGKDCSECLFPHEKGNYDEIINRIEKDGRT
jgi:Zn-finger protein